jgi:hypothetical protein
MAAWKVGLRKLMPCMCCMRRAGARTHSEWDAVEEADDGADEYDGDQNVVTEGTGGVVQGSGSAQKEVRRQKKAIIQQLVDAVKEQLGKHLVGRVLQES